MKKIIITILVLVFMLALLSTSFAAGKKKTVMLGDSLTDAELICCFPFGEKENEIGYKNGDAFNEGPESFAVNDEGIYILDSVKNRIIISNEEGLRYIDLSECCGYPYHMCVSENLIYILDYNGEKIMTFNEYGESQKPIPFPDKIGFDSIKRILYSDGKLQIQTYKNDYYVYDEAWLKAFNAELKGDFETEKTLTIDENTIFISTGENTAAELLQFAGRNIYLGVNEFVPYIPVIESEYTVRKYDTDGDLEGITVIDTIPAVSLPRDCVYFNNLGEVFVMQCRYDGVYISKPHFRTEYYSHMEELSKIGNEIYQLVLEEPKTRTSTITSNTRTTIQSRANSAANLHWVIKNADFNPPSGATAPQCVTNNHANDTVTGIPYCYGAYLSSANQFKTLHNGNYTAGNINKTNGYVSTTAGLDCSGFVSYAYSLGSHHKTKYFNNNGVAVSVGGGGSGNQYSHNSTALANMEPMDYLLKYISESSNSNHIMLFSSFSNNTLTIYDSTTMTSNDNVSVRHPTSNNMTGYVLKSPYACGGTAPCSYGSYQYDILHHWKECSYHCGNISSYNTHTWVNAPGGGYDCNVCGCHTDVLPYGSKPLTDK